MNLTDWIGIFFIAALVTCIIVVFIRTERTIESPDEKIYREEMKKYE